MEDEFKEIKTGNGIDRDLAATTNNRLEKTILELRNLTSEVRVLNTNVIRQSKSNDRYSRKLIALTWVLVFFTIFLVIMTGVLIEDGRNTASTQDNIVLNSQFFNIVNTGIIAAMEDNKPILQENRGQFIDAQLDNYLGDFDILQSSYDNKLLDENDFCDSFLYYIQLTNQNKEVQNYIAEQQKFYPGSFMSLAYLSNIVEKSSNENCK